MKAPMIPNNKPRSRRISQPAYHWLHAVSHAGLLDYREALDHCLQQRTASAEDIPPLRRLRVAIDAELARRDQTLAIAEELN